MQDVRVHGWAAAVLFPAVVFVFVLGGDGGCITSERTP